MNLSLKKCLYNNKKIDSSHSYELWFAIASQVRVVFEELDKMAGQSVFSMKWKYGLLNVILNNIYLKPFFVFKCN